MISKGEWNAIQSSARAIKMELISLPAPKGVSKACKKTKTYFKTYFSRDWDQAIDKLESQEPLLQLCATHWKAEQLLGNILLRRSNISLGEEDTGSDSEEPEESSHNKKRRRLTGSKGKADLGMFYIECYV
jgi:hypothetical protein